MRTFSKLVLGITGRCLAVALGFAMVFALSSVAFGKKTFPANPDSIAEENRKAESLGLTRYEDERAVSAAVERGDLVAITVRCDKRLPRDRRYARPAAVLFVAQLDSEMYAEVKGHITVNSATRSADVQKRLCRVNINAAPPTGEKASPHETGNAVDLSMHMSRKQRKWLLARLGYYQGIGAVLIIEERSCYHIFITQGDITL